MAKNTEEYFILSIWNHTSSYVLLFVFEIEKRRSEAWLSTNDRARKNVWVNKT